MDALGHPGTSADAVERSGGTPGAAAAHRYGSLHLERASGLEVLDS